MQTLAQIKELLEAHGLAPKKSMGQNFLIDHNLIRKLVDASRVGPGDLVLEVGPGTGTMTEELLARGCEVIACELDDGMAALNAARLPGLPGGEKFKIIHADCLSGKHAVNPAILDAIGGRAFSLVANLPYGAATPLMSLLLVEHPHCRLQAITIQREVADRLLAKPGTKDYGGLAVIAQAAARVERITSAPPECFWPRPDVTSSMVLLERLDTPLTPDLKLLSGFCRVIFAQRRKQLSSLLKPFDWERAKAFPGAGEGGTGGAGQIAPSLRAEQLSPVQIVWLMQAARDQGWIPSPPP